MVLDGFRTIFFRCLRAPRLSPRASLLPVLGLPVKAIHLLFSGLLVEEWGGV